MSFRFVPNSVILNDLERRNFCIISPNSVTFGTHYIKWLKIHRYFLGQKCRPRNPVVSDISLTTILAQITLSESVKVRHFPLDDENLTITWKRYKIGDKLVLITNRKSYMSFRLVLKSVTLNDLERCNDSYFALFQPICCIITTCSVECYCHGSDDAVHYKSDETVNFWVTGICRTGK